MKILQVISSFPPAYAYGGPVKAVYDLSKELVKRGHDVTVYTTDVFDRRRRLDCTSNPINMDGIDVCRFHNFDNAIIDTAFDFAPKMANALKKNVDKFDLVHLHEYRSFQSMLVQHYATKSGVPYILQPHGSLSRFGKQSQKKIFDNMFGHRIVRDSSLMIASSTIELDSCISTIPWINAARVSLLPDYIDISEFHNLPNFGRFRERIGIGPQEKMVLYLSRIHKLKGADVLIRAFSQVKKELPAVKLVIAGPDEGFLSELKVLASLLNLDEHVIFTGPLYGQEKKSAFMDADVFILPSHYESFGIVVLEAMACGVPVILTERCGVKDWVGHLTVSIRLDENELMRAMVNILTDDILSERLGREGRQFVLNRFNWNQAIQEFQNSYTSLME